MQSTNPAAPDDGVPPPPRPAPPSYGVVFDIDGVLLKGETLIPGAREAVEKVRAANAPYVFVTNQGWLDEADRASLLSQQLALPVSPAQVVLAHSALREEVAAVGAGLVLVTGRCRCDAASIVRGYGFPNVHTIAEYAAAHPHLHPLKHAGGNNGADKRPASADAPTPAWAAAPVAAVFVIETPEDWHEDLQVIVDLVRSAGGRPGEHGAAGGSGSGSGSKRQQQQAVRLVVCNFDFVFAAEHGVPRFGPGAFFAALEALHARATAPGNGGTPSPLAVVRHGKPHPPAYVAALRKLQAQAGEQALAHVYALGDNPASDVRGANAAGGPWRSVLVRTGVWGGADPVSGSRVANDSDDPAHFVCESAAEAVAMILETEAGRARQQAQGGGVAVAAVP